MLSQTSGNVYCTQQMLNLESKDILRKKCFPWFPLLLGSSKNTQHPRQLFSMAAANSKASVSRQSNYNKHRIILLREQKHH